MFPAFGLYTHIRANRIRSVALFVGLVLLVYVMTYAGALFAESLGSPAPLDVLLWRAFGDFLAAAPLATIGVGVWIAIAYAFHQKMIDAVTGAAAVTRAQEPRLYNLLENLCISRGLPMPRLEIAETPVLNAFATGLNERQYAITLTRGLIEALDDAEIEAVLGHELTHIRNGDVATMVIAVVIAGILSFAGELFFRVIMRMRFEGPIRSGDGESGDRRRGKGGAAAGVLIAAALIALAWALSQLIRFALSRSREFLADAGSVELTKNPDAMISALMKISGKGELPGVPSGVMEMCLDNPRSGFADLFATHPSIEDRVAALVKYAGGRPPPPAPASLPEPPPAAGPWGPHPGAGDPDPSGP
ncbi:M48 family metallopeptidase [Alsobacter sp. SYSU M60028]|uniref:M48 family metallopeptidase n=1 Tax=Alsobacter ponti TaxID=2962936 RepID=A0ABT1LBJ8_9HYPH|nr:M48 family metallopeptidase [Alsobacter ponti]MCP8938857.1 M48 family metallopeptidase [Alsobacter ponti]